MVVTNIVCAVVAVVVLGGDGAGGRARGVDHFTSSQQSPRCSSSPSCLPHDLEPAPSSPVFALGRGPRRGSCRVLVRSLVGGRVTAAASEGTNCRTRGNTGHRIFVTIG